MLLKTRMLTKWSRVVRWNSLSASSTTSNKVRQIIWWILVCVLIHLECWLDKAWVEIVTWPAVVIKFSSVNVIDMDSIRIRCTSGKCAFNSHSSRIQSEKGLWNTIHYRIQSLESMMSGCRISSTWFVAGIPSPVAFALLHTSYISSIVL